MVIFVIDSYHCSQQHTSSARLRSGFWWELSKMTLAMSGLCEFPVAGRLCVLRFQPTWRAPRGTSCEKSNRTLLLRKHCVDQLTFWIFWVVGIESSWLSLNGTTQKEYNHYQCKHKQSNYIAKLSSLYNNNYQLWASYYLCKDKSALIPDCETLSRSYVGRLTLCWSILPSSHERSGKSMPSQRAVWLKLVLTEFGISDDVDRMNIILYKNMYIYIYTLELDLKRRRLGSFFRRSPGVWASSFFCAKVSSLQRVRAFCAQPLQKMLPWCWNWWDSTQFRGCLWLLNTMKTGPNRTQ